MHYHNRESILLVLQSHFDLPLHLMSITDSGCHFCKCYKNSSWLEFSFEGCLQSLKFTHGTYQIKGFKTVRGKCYGNDLSNTLLKGDNCLTTSSGGFGLLRYVLFIPQQRVKKRVHQITLRKKNNTQT